MQLNFYIYLRTLSGAHGKQRVYSVLSAAVTADLRKFFICLPPLEFLSSLAKKITPYRFGTA